VATRRVELTEAGDQSCPPALALWGSHVKTSVGAPALRRRLRLSQDSWVLLKDLSNYFSVDFVVWLI